MDKNQTFETENKEPKTGGLEIIPRKDVVLEEPISAKPEEPVKEKKKKATMGVVTNCLSLNVRRRPRVDPNPTSVVATITCLTEVEIDEEKSTDEFYKIFTATGVEGFCMKKFIAVRQ